MKINSKTLLLKACSAIVFLLASCVSSNSGNLPGISYSGPSTSNEPPLAPDLIDVTAKMAASESSAAPQHVFPYFSISKYPPLRVLKPGYSHRSFSALNSDGQAVFPQLLKLGIESVSYSSHEKNIGPQAFDYSSAASGDEQMAFDYMKISIESNEACITVEHVTQRFGEVYKTIPPAIVAPIQTSPEFQIGRAGRQNKGITGMTYENKFKGAGSVTFSFEYQRCAKYIYLKTRK